MPPVEVPDYKGLWEESVYESLTLLFDFLLPTGIIIQLEVPRHASLQEIKEKLWNEAQQYPLYSQLKDKSFYVFMCVTEMADRIELEEESVRISYVRPFSAMLKVVEKKGNRAEKILNAQISVLIGKGLHEFEALKEPEVNQFRTQMKAMCERVVKERDDQPWLQKVMCFYPPDIASDPELPPHLAEKLKNGSFMVFVKLPNYNHVSYTFFVSCDCTPDGLCQMALEKSAKTSGQPVQRSNKVALKVVGREEYLLGDYPIKQFMYMRRTLSKGLVPTLLLVYRDNIFAGEAPMLPPRVSKTPQKTTSPPSPHSHRRGKCLWDLNSRYALKIAGVTNVNLLSFHKVQLRCGIYHGSEPLCPVNNTKEIMVKDGLATWNEEVLFDINLQDLPRMARLCFLLYALPDRRGKEKRPPTGGNKKQNKHTIPLAWVNITLFDYQDYLRPGSQTLYMWSITDDCILTEELLNPIGTVECNPHANEAVCLKFFFNRAVDSPIYYPPFEKVLDVAAQNMKTKGEKPTDIEGIRKTFSGMVFDENLVSKDKLELLRLMVDRDPLDPLHEHEKEMIWNLRFECNFHFKDSLPKLLTCVNWANHISVAQMQALLQIWRRLEPTNALELLDHQYADKAVRKFAVDCLNDLSDSDVYQFLLQLVQALKYESYLECDLVEFLLKRSLRNKRIGHAFFWLLRAEMHVPSVSVRFGLILEAYCRGNINHLKGLVKEVEALGKLKLLSDAVKKFKDKDKERTREEMRKMILQQPFFTSLSDITCPLDPGQRFKSPIPQQCKFMDSKMKPLWLVMENSDENGDNIFLMYKRGDDLRQDMLTLQILRIMDSIWQAENLDLRLNAYGCLSTGHHEGFIEVVTQSDTLANIQKHQGNLKLAAAFNNKCLYKYLETYNKDPQSLKNAIMEFSRSCAGYSVATYVLGVADRHSDNIMLKQNGQFFHIDFGHILGHFKYKLGVKRERVPFVLTTDFVYVIKEGPDNNNQAFRDFQKMCEDAYMALRRKSNFLITLFLMMMNTGIPEVSCTKDIEYLKGTLRPDCTDQEALEHFRGKFKEALKNSWKASLNFAARNIKGDNT